MRTCARSSFREVPEVVLRKMSHQRVVRSQRQLGPPLLQWPHCSTERRGLLCKSVQGSVLACSRSCRTLLSFASSVVSRSCRSVVSRSCRTPLSFASSVVFFRSRHDRAALSPRVLQHSCRAPLSFASSVVFLRSRHDRVVLSPRALKLSCGNARLIY